MTKDHNDHMPDPALVAKYRVATNVKAAARANVLVPSGQILDQHLQGLTQEEASKVPRRSAIQRAVNRARDHVQGGAVDSAPEHMQIPPVFQQTKDHQQFLRVDTRQADPQSPTFLVFASPRGLQQLQRERQWCMDGTFFCRPKHFAQLYVIGVFKKRSFVPCAYFLLPNKEAATYQRAFNAFFTLPELRDASPAVLMADFEVAPANAMKELFPDVQVVHCQFHLAQNLLKHIRQKGLIDVYRNEEARLLLLSLWALAFLPPDEVADGYEALVVALNVLNNREVIPLDRLADLQSIIRDYFERNYIRRFNPRGVLVDPLFPPNSWNVNEAVIEDGARTNNSQEGWNRGFNARFQRSTGKLSKFLLRLQEDEEQTRQLLDR
ncbi:hypothetical protein AAVH_33585, partial [Aphelenchoides avenae]